MTVRSYDALNVQGMRLYDEQKYAEALELLTREGNNFPEHEAEIAYLRSCMAARIGKPELAVAILEEALQHGHWYGRQVMRLTPSWQRLQGTPDFERVATICKEREVAEHPESRVFVREPEGGIQAGQRYPLFIALHGNADNATHALDGWQAVTSAEWMLAAIQSSQMVGSQSFGWFDIEQATREIEWQYAKVREQYAIDTERVVLAGFSGGGELALRLSLDGTIPARGFVLLGPAITAETTAARLPLIQERAAQGLRGYVMLGEEDLNVPQDEIRAVVALLNDHGIPCGIEEIPDLGHSYPTENTPMLQRALAFIEEEA